MAIPEIDLTVFPDDCDAFGHLNQASFLRLFERARWEMLAGGPGMDAFTRSGVWPAVRKASVDYSAAAYPGDVLRFTTVLIHIGRTSLTLRQAVRRVSDDRPVATAEFVFVCIDRAGRATPVPGALRDFLSQGEGGSAPARVTVNGVRLAVEVQGDGPAVLFIHGYPLDRTIWSQVMASLPGLTVIAPDLRGMGLSDAPDLGYSMATYAEDLAALLDARGVDRVVLCGLSMGGYVALEFLRRWRGRVRGLILMDTRADADTPEGRRARDEAAAAAREGGGEAIARAMLPKLLTPATLTERPGVAERVRTMMARAPVPGIVGALAAMRDRSDSSDLLPSLADLPTLILVGAEDRLTPPDRAEAMARAIPGARMEVIPGAGHLPPVEQPEATSAAIAAFLGSLP